VKWRRGAAAVCGAFVLWLAAVCAGSQDLRAAAQAMGLSYSKALRMVKRAEKELGFALTRKTIGGRGGGGSTLTDEARNFMERYEAYRDACVQTDRELYYKFFPDER